MLIFCNDKLKILALVTKPKIPAKYKSESENVTLEIECPLPSNVALNELIEFPIGIKLSTPEQFML